LITSSAAQRPPARKGQDHRGVDRQGVGGLQLRLSAQAQADRAGDKGDQAAKAQNSGQQRGIAKRFMAGSSP
jgi:hypothetical protein